MSPINAVSGVSPSAPVNAHNDPMAAEVASSVLAEVRKEADEAAVLIDAAAPPTGDHRGARVNLVG